MNSSDYNLTRENNFEIKFKDYEDLQLCVSEAQIIREKEVILVRITFYDIDKIDVTKVLNTMLKDDEVCMQISTLTPEGKTKSIIIDDKFKLEKYSTSLNINGTGFIQFQAMFMHI